MIKEFSERLRRLLYEKRWNQSKLAKKTGIDIGTISRWKVRGSIPHNDSLEKIVTATGCSFDWLRDNKGEMFPKEKGTSYSNVQIQSGRDTLHHSTKTGSRTETKGCNRCSGFGEDVMELASLIKQCESPIAIRQKINEYAKMLEQFQQ